MTRVMSAPPAQQPMTGTKTPMTPMHEMIAMRAFEKWCKRGRMHGCDLQDWFEAENEVKKEMMMPGGTSMRR